MAKWTAEDLLKLDERYAEEGVAFHARPFRAAMDILGSEFALGFGAGTAAQDVMDAYRALIPEVDAAWPGLGIGLAASVDRVRKVTVAVAFGHCRISVHEGLGFGTHEEWATWCRGNPEIAANSAYAFADLFDLTYGLDDLQRGDPTAVGLWQLALSNLEDVANILTNGFSMASVLQPICLTAELAMKGTLAFCGTDAKTLSQKSVGHHHDVLADMMAKARPHRDDGLVRAVAAALPDYVNSRYKAAGLSRLQVVRLALGAQFVAASALRRISDRDFAIKLEIDSWPGPRRSFFPSASDGQGQETQ